MPSLTRSEAVDRAALLEVTAYQITLDLTGGDRTEVTTFGSRSQMTFTCTEPGATTFLDLRAEQVGRITLNGRDLDPGAVVDGRVALEGLATDNEMVVEAVMAYSRDGQGLHRAEDPADGRHYVYGHLFLDAAPRVFACFDQPDLKAPVTLTVDAPQEWTVLGNGVAGERQGTQVQLATTPPISTYVVTVCAGPYVSVTGEHDGIPLGVHARASLAEPLRAQAGAMLQLTADCFDAYHRLFGIRYPFGAYHQVFVPEFNAGAMENPGCVTFRDQLIFRGAATDDEVLSRSTTIAHEMAHMWFGDLVTMRWWDDLWLNESFAEYLAHRTLVEVTDNPAAWVDATVARKIWGYAAERTPSTHPVAGSPAPDADSALQNFDGISYAKGAAVLRQLIEHIGDDAFVAGVRSYLQRHAWGNAALADFLAEMEQGAGRDLSAWAGAWLSTAGLDRIAAEVAGAELRVTRTPPQDHPASRPHTLDVAGWTDGDQVMHTRLTITSDDTWLTGAPGVRPALVLPNAGDLTWAQVALSPATVVALTEQLPQVTDAQHRAVVWTALVDGLALTTVDPRDVLATFSTAYPVEDDPSILTRVGQVMTTRLLPEYLPDLQARGAVALAARSRLESADPDSSTALTAARVVAASSVDTGLLYRWSRGEGLPDRLATDLDLGWLVVRGLAVHGAIDETGIARRREGDVSLQGELAALTARAALPGAEAKEWAWRELVGPGRSTYERNALAGGFWLSGGPEVLRPYVARYLSDLPALVGRVGPDALGRLALLAFPRTVVEEATDRAVTERLAAEDLTPGVRRSMVDMRSVLREVVTARSTFG